LIDNLFRNIPIACVVIKHWNRTEGKSELMLQSILFDPDKKDYFFKTKIDDSMKDQKGKDLEEGIFYMVTRNSNSLSFILDKEEYNCEEFNLESIWDKGRL